jgi:hypothetical protein
MKKLIIFISFFLVSMLFLTLSIKGQTEGSHVLQQTEKERNGLVGSPFESSGSRSRYAIVEAIVENKSFAFTTEQAKFASPDISAYNGKAFSLFSPGVSFLSVPFYMIGKLFGIPQIFTYYSLSLFAVLNTFLIYLLARKLGAGFYASLISGFLFLFATNAFAYTLSFTQHIMTVTFLLLSIINALGKRTFINNILLGAIVGAGFLIDLPNVIFMAPAVIYAFTKQFSISNAVEKLKIAFNPSFLWLLIGLFPFLMIFGHYNAQLTGSPTKIAQLIGNAQITDNKKGDQQIKQNEDATENTSKISLPFESRRLLNGLYILLLSNERSWIFYSPVILLGIAGFITVYQKKKEIVILFSSVVGVGILAYAMFIDPWGGWSYGARYLIPSAAVLAIGIAPLLDRFKKNYIFIPVFFALASFSLYINTLGAYTTSAIPPKVEAVALLKPIPYTYEYNFQLLQKQNFSSSLFYNLYLSNNISSKNYIMLFSGTLAVTLFTLYIMAYKEKEQKEN